MAVPPHQHPFDWYVIPELNGKNPSYMAYCSGSWVCRLCSSDKLMSVEEHCRTPEHIQNMIVLEERRNELSELVAKQEEVIRQKRMEEQREQQRLQLEKLQKEEEEMERLRQAKLEEERAMERNKATEKRLNPSSTTASISSSLPLKYSYSPAGL